MKRVFHGCRDYPEAVVVGLFLSFAAFNLWSRVYPPLHDLPGHAAHYALRARDLFHRAPSPYYRFEPTVVPNMAGDLVIVPLSFVLSVRTACKIFLLASTFLFWLGPAAYLGAISENRRASSRAALCLLPFAWCTAFSWGFVNWYFGVGLTFLVLADHRRLLDRGGILGWRRLLHSAWVCLLFLCHLSAWVMYLLVATLDTAVAGARAYRREGSLRPVVASAIPSVLAMLPSFGLAVIYKLQSRGDFAVDPRAGFRWGTLSDKAKGLVSWCFLSYDFRLDLVVFGLVVLAVLVWFRIDLRPRGFRPKPALFLAGLALFLVIPRGLGTTEGADVRVLPLAVVGFLALLADRPIRAGGLGFALLVCALGIRQFEIHQAWTRIGSRLDEHAATFRRFSEGSRVYPVVLLPDWDAKSGDRIFHDWAAVERGAFLPDLFAIPGQSMLRKGEFPCGISEPLGSEPWGRRVIRRGESVDLTRYEAIECYDFLWLLNRAGAVVKPPRGFEIVEHRGDLTVWQRVSSPVD